MDCEMNRDFRNWSVKLAFPGRIPAQEMKHCPKGKKNYADPTLSFCLQDGAPLIFGSAVEEPTTAILSGDEQSDAPTRRIDPHTTEPTESYAFGESQIKESGRPRNYIWILGGIAVVAVILASVFGYRYFANADSKQIDSGGGLSFGAGRGHPHLS